MALARFSLLVTMDQAGGIAKEGAIPWNLRGLRAWVKSRTIGAGDNAMIMGRTTYERIPDTTKPIRDRTVFVLSRTWHQRDHGDVNVYASFLDALAGIGSQQRGNHPKYKEVFVVGGASVFERVMKDFLYLCDTIYVTQLKEDYRCDTFFPVALLKGLSHTERITHLDYERITFKPDVVHPEQAFLDTLGRVTRDGALVGDTHALPSVHMTFPITTPDGRFPLITTRNIEFAPILAEAVHVLRGCTRASDYQAAGVVGYRVGARTMDVNEEEALTLPEGDMGPSLPFQLRHWGAPYDECGSADHGGVDQLQHVLRTLRAHPFDEEHVLVGWNPSDRPFDAFPTRCVSLQFFPSGDRSHLDAQVTLAASNLFSQFPKDLAFYAVVAFIVAAYAGYTPRNITFSVGRAYVEASAQPVIAKQLARTPRPLPPLSFSTSWKWSVKLDQLTTGHVQLGTEQYRPCPHISAP